MRRALTLLLVLTVAGAAQAAQDTIKRGFNVSPGGTLTIDADLGDILVVTGGTGVAVEISREARGRKNLDDLQVAFDQSGNDVNIRAKFVDRELGGIFRRGDEYRVRYNVRVPANYSVSLGTSGGDIEVRDLVGTADCRTSGGDVKLGRVQGSANVRTSGGDLELAGVTGSVVAKTSGGDIDVDEAGGSVEARTSGGSIKIGRSGGGVLARTSGGSIDVEDAGGSIDASTSGGGIHARLRGPLSAHSRLSTSGGSITLTVGSGLAADLDARASGGGVDSDMPITVQGKFREDSLVGKINGGGPKLTLRTSGGGITIKRM